VNDRNTNPPITTFSSGGSGGQVAITTPDSSPPPPTTPLDASWLEGTQLPSLTSADHSRLKWTIAFGIVIGAALTSVASLIALLVLIELSQIG
jgi:hypothetical protein